MSYIDGMVASVPTANKEAYLAHAKTASTVLPWAAWDVTAYPWVNVR